MPYYIIEEPAELVTFCEEKPEARWNELKADPDVNLAVKSNVVKKTGGLCVYCEQKLIKKIDFQIEHYYPKDPDCRDGGDPNWAIQWSNLYACCLGGTARPADFDGDAKALEDRVASRRPNHSCGQRKRNRKPEGIFVNPVQVKNDRSLYKYNAVDGSISPADDLDALGVSREIVAKHIETLNLDCTRLKGSRKSFIDALDSEFECMMESPELLSAMVDDWLSLGEDGMHALPFFSAILFRFGK